MVAIRSILHTSYEPDEEAPSVPPVTARDVINRSESPSTLCEQLDRSRRTVSGVEQAREHAAIRADRVTFRYQTKKGPLEALRDVSFTVEPNAFVSVIGPSGCGKSTLLKLVSGVLRRSAGEVLIDGQPIERLDLTGRFGYVFQRPLLLPWRSALENVLLPAEIVHKRVRDIHRARAREFLDLVGLSEFEHAAPHELSGGMQQRVALARALAMEPSILLMDEPFSALDEITREAMQAELLQIWQQTRTTVLFVTHHIEEAVLLSERIVVLSRRPGTVRRTVEIDLPRPRDAADREDPRFRKIVGELRGLLIHTTVTDAATEP